MDVYLPGESIERYYEVMQYRNIDDQIAAELKKYVHLCQMAARHNADEEEYKEMACDVFYHIQELRSTHEPSPLVWTNRRHRFYRNSSR